MPTISETRGEGNARTLDEEFLELVCSDEELLRAEFEAIVAAGWPRTPARPPLRRPAGRPPTPRGGPRRERPPDRLATRPRHPGVGGWARQRSPPPPRSRDHAEHPKAGSREPHPR
jgi:hypothetical protein